MEPVTVHRYNMKKVASYCEACHGSFNFLLLGSSSKKETKDRIFFVWDRNNTLAGHLRSNAPEVELDQVMVDGFKSGSLLAFGSASSASDVIYGNASAAYFSPPVSTATSLFGSVTDFLGRFPLTSAFFADATKKPHPSAPGWSIRLNAFTYDKFRVALQLADDVVIGRHHKMTTKDKVTSPKTESSPRKKSTKRERAVEEPVAAPLPSSSSTKRQNMDREACEAFLAANPVSPYQRSLDDTHPLYVWPDRGTSLYPQDMYVAPDGHPTLLYYDRVEHDRVVAEWVRLNALHPAPRPIYEVELAATRYLLHQWTAYPSTSEYFRIWRSQMHAFENDRPGKKINL